MRRRLFRPLNSGNVSAEQATISLQNDTASDQENVGRRGGVEGPAQ